MSGVRQTRSIICSHCGATGTIGLGMPLIGPMASTREFSCIQCKQTLHVEAPREILAIDWAPIASAGQRGAASIHAAD